MKINHIYWFAPYNLNNPSTRYRGYHPLLYLKNKYGIGSDFVYPERSIRGVRGFMKAFFSALLFRKKNSVIVIQKVCSNRFYANLLKTLVLLQPKNTHYDIDDAEYLRQEVNTLHFFLSKCKTVSVGSSALKTYCDKFNQNVFILTSPVIDHVEKKTERNKTPNIGWVGDFGDGNEISKEFSHKTSMFNILFPQLSNLKFPFTLTLIGVKNKLDIPEIKACFDQNPNISLNILTNLNWENDEWLYPEIKKFDIGLSPLSNHPFNTAKSAFKAKQYLSVGIPTLASDIGENKNFVTENVNGHLCKNGDDFETGIVKIANMDDESYFEMSRKALGNTDEFSMKTYCELFIKVFKFNKNDNKKETRPETVL